MKCPESKGSLHIPITYPHHGMIMSCIIVWTDYASPVGAEGDVPIRDDLDRRSFMPTPSMEDYLEVIYKLIEEKGYARVSDIAEALEVHPSSVTKMVQKLDQSQYLIYEKYRGLVLTPKGKKIGKRLLDRHTLLEEFLRIIGVDESRIYDDVEGIEHHLSWDSINSIEYLVEYFQKNPERVKELQAFKQANELEEIDS